MVFNMIFNIIATVCGAVIAFILSTYGANANTPGFWIAMLSLLVYGLVMKKSD
jgi:hypothetical protein